MLLLAACVSPPHVDLVDSPSDALGLAYVLVEDIAAARDQAVAAGVLDREGAADVTAQLLRVLDVLGVARQALAVGQPEVGTAQLEAAQRLMASIIARLAEHGITMSSAP